MATPGYTQGEFEIEFVPFLTGKIEALSCEVNEQPSRIFDINDNWFVDVKWKLEGPLRRFICGYWGVDVYMESIGRGPEFELPDEDKEKIPLQPNATGEYQTRFNVPSGFIRTHVENWWEEHKEGGKGPGEREQDIVYKMVVTVTYRDSLGVPGPIAGFVEMPMLQFYYAE